MARSYEKVQLSDIANIRTGFTFREKIEEIKNGDAYILQIKDARKAWSETNSFIVSPSTLPMIEWKGKDQAFVEAESILLPARGEYNRASYLSPGRFPVIASSQFFILSAKNNLTLPEYLCWALNQSSAQNYLNQESRGSNISMLSITSVNQLKIPVPQIDIQRKIIQLNRAWEQEQQLTQKLLSNREIMLKGIFKKLLTEPKK